MALAGESLVSARAPRRPLTGPERAAVGASKRLAAARERGVNQEEIDWLVARLRTEPGTSRELPWTEAECLAALDKARAVVAALEKRLEFIRASEHVLAKHEATFRALAATERVERGEGREP